jgi:hypothetical protein
VKTLAVCSIIVSLVSALIRRSISRALGVLLLCTFFWGGSANAADLVWASQQRIPNVGSTFGPSLVVNGSGFGNPPIYAAWKDAKKPPGEQLLGDDQGIYWSTYNGGNNPWGPPGRIPNVGSSIGPSLAVFGPNILLFAAWKGVGDDQGIYWSTARVGP